MLRRKKFAPMPHRKRCSGKLPIVRNSKIQTDGSPSQDIIGCEREYVVWEAQTLPLFSFQKQREALRPSSWSAAHRWSFAPFQNIDSHRTIPSFADHRYCGSTRSAKKRIRRMSSKSKIGFYCNWFVDPVDWPSECAIRNPQRSFTFPAKLGFRSIQSFKSMHGFNDGTKQRNRKARTFEAKRFSLILSVNCSFNGKEPTIHFWLNK